MQNESQNCLFQVSTSGALVQGDFHSTYSSRSLLRHGNFGLGTFEGLDGEMIVLENEIYQMLGDGTLKRRIDDFLLPFAQVCWFDGKTTFALENIGTLKDAENACTPHRFTNNLFYAIRITGHFRTAHTRTVRPAREGSSLVDAGKHQATFTFEDVDATMIGFWSPAFSSSFSVPHYHFHFITADRKHGGHLLECSAEHLEAAMQTLSTFHVELPTVGPFLTTNLNIDTTTALTKAE